MEITSSVDNNDNELIKVPAPETKYECYLCKENMRLSSAHYIYNQSGLDMQLESLINYVYQANLNIKNDFCKGICESCFLKLTLNEFKHFNKLKCMGDVPNDGNSKFQTIAKDLTIDIPEDIFNNNQSQAYKNIVDLTINVGDSKQIYKFDVTTEKNIPKTILDKNEDRLETNNKEKYVIDQNIAVNIEFAESFHCAYCGFPLKSPADVLEHRLEHVSLNEFTCIICKAAFKKVAALGDHMLLHFDIPAKYECKICSTAYECPELLEKHVCTSALPENNTCTVCAEVFPTRVRLNFHKRFHKNKSKALFCEKCNIIFLDENQLFDHVKCMHTVCKEYKCDHCDKKFISKTRMTNHLCNHSNNRNHKCDICEKRFFDKQTLNEHKASHMTVKPYQCHICGKYFNRNSRLKKHLLGHESKKIVLSEIFSCNICNEVFCYENFTDDTHDSVCTGSTEQSVVEMVFRCEYCERCYTTGDSLNAHRSTHSGPTPYTCNVCGVQFSTYSRCVSHKTTHGWYKGNNTQESFPVTKHFLCEHCGRSFLHWSYFQVHRKLKHDSNPQSYTCKNCGKKFPNNWGVAHHRTKCLNGAPKFTCNYCVDEFPTQALLTKHKTKAHAGEQNFSCAVCDKNLRSQATLEAHLLIHVPESQKLRCRICEKAFVNNTGLRSHYKRIHQGETEHECSYCDQRFYKASDKINHERKHTGEKPFECGYCGKTFRTRGMCTQHTKIHEDVRPYQCETCGSAFRRSFSLKTHLKTHTLSHKCEYCEESFRVPSELTAHMEDCHETEMFLMPFDDDIEQNQNQHMNGGDAEQQLIGQGMLLESNDVIE